MACFLAACSQTAPPSRGPLVILRFDNLTGDAALDWMGRGAARAIAAQIEGAAIADSAQPAEEREHAIAGGAKRILHGYLSRTGGRLRLQADLEDVRSSKFPRSAEASGPESAGLPPIADAVARQLDPKARPPATKSGAALQAYVAAFDMPNPAAAGESLMQAIEADPDFGSPYLALIEFDLARRDHAGAEHILGMARARGACAYVHRPCSARCRLSATGRRFRHAFEGACHVGLLDTGRYQTAGETGRIGIASQAL